MALKNSYATEAEIPAALKTEYKERDGAWYLDVDGAEDTAALLRAKDHEKRLRQAAETEAKKLRDEKEASELERIKATGDVVKLKEAYDARIAEMEKKQADAAKAIENGIKKSAIDAAALKLATEISTVPALMARTLAERMTADVVDGIAFVRVLTADGKVSALSPADLGKEMLSNADYAPIIIKSKASGGSAAPKAGQAQQVPGSAGPKRIAEMTELERRDFYARDKAAFIAQRDAEQAATT